MSTNSDEKSLALRSDKVQELKLDMEYGDIVVVRPMSGPSGYRLDSIMGFTGIDGAKDACAKAVAPLSRIPPTPKRLGVAGEAGAPACFRA